MSKSDKVLLFPKPKYLEIFKKKMTYAQPLDPDEKSFCGDLADLVISEFLKKSWSK